MDDLFQGLLSTGRGPVNTQRKSDDGTNAILPPFGAVFEDGNPVADSEMTDAGGSLVGMSVSPDQTPPGANPEADRVIQAPPSVFRDPDDPAAVDPLADPDSDPRPVTAWGDTASTALFARNEIDPPIDERQRSTSFPPTALVGSQQRNVTFPDAWPLGHSVPRPFATPNTISTQPSTELPSLPAAREGGLPTEIAPNRTGAATGMGGLLSATALVSDADGAALPALPGGPARGDALPMDPEGNPDTARDTERATQRTETATASRIALEGRAAADATAQAAGRTGMPPPMADIGPAAGRDAAPRDAMSRIEVPFPGDRGGPAVASAQSASITPQPSTFGQASSGIMTDAVDVATDAPDPEFPERSAREIRKDADQTPQTHARSAGVSGSAPYAFTAPSGLPAYTTQSAAASGVSTAPFDGEMGVEAFSAMQSNASAHTTSLSPSAPMPSGLPPNAPNLVAQQIAAALQDRGNEPGQPIDIALDPPELGRVRLHMVELAGVLTLTIHAERPETAELMRRHLDLLAEEFSDAGVDAPAVRISQDGADERPARQGLPEQATSTENDTTDATAASLPHPMRTSEYVGALDLRL